jgi:hypothetical protein
MKMPFIKTNFNSFFATIYQRKPRFREMLYKHESCNNRRVYKNADNKNEARGRNRVKQKGKSK